MIIGPSACLAHPFSCVIYIRFGSDGRGWPPSESREVIGLVPRCAAPVGAAMSGHEAVGALAGLKPRPRWILRGVIDE